jgi:hypothetical protein
MYNVNIKQISGKYLFFIIQLLNVWAKAIQYVNSNNYMRTVYYWNKMLGIGSLRYGFPVASQSIVTSSGGLMDRLNRL